MSADAERSHLTFGATPSVTLEQALADIARDNAFFDAWHADWMAYYGGSAGGRVDASIAAVATV